MHFFSFVSPFLLRSPVFSPHVVGSHRVMEVNFHSLILMGFIGSEGVSTVDLGQMSVL